MEKSARPPTWMPVSDQCLGIFLDTPSIAPRAICMAIYDVTYKVMDCMYSCETSRRPRYVVGYEDGSRNDVVGYHRYLNLDLLISQSTYQPLS
jgi:hypothetical protein